MLAKTTQNANPVPLASSLPQLRRFLPSSRSAPGLVPGPIGGFMVCYQVVAQFAFYQRKPALVSTHFKKQNVKSFLVLSGLSFGSGLKVRRFFKTKKEAARYVSYLHAVYKGRIIPNPPLPGGQQYLFQEVSE
ncbi:MAG: hypothetical protein LBF74_11110 [Treponema sp.]|nr:hypothetical protein [Treponema sp.]